MHHIILINIRLQQKTINITCFRSNTVVKLVIEPASGISHVSNYFAACMEAWRSIPRVLLDEISDDPDDCSKFEFS